MIGGQSVLLEHDVASAVRGDEEAFRRLVERCANTVCSIALGIVRNVQASEDVAQEVFLAAWSSLRKLKNPASFLPWLRQITRNQAHVWLRENRREIAADDILSEAIDERPSPSDAMLRQEERRLLQDVLDGLPEDARDVVILFYREGSSVRQVADLLGISQDAVKQRRSRIREEMLLRFGQMVTRTAPGAAFFTVVGAALTYSAPGASAAVAAGLAAKSGGGKFASTLLVLAKGAGLGALASVAGVLMGMVHIGSPFDDQEASELRKFKWQAILTVLVANLAFMVTNYIRPFKVWVIVVFLGYTGSLIYLYLVRLPRILQRRFAWERELDPTAAARQRSIFHGEIAMAFSASISGGLLYLAIAHALE